MVLIFILFFAELIVILRGSFYLDGSNWRQHITCWDPDYFFFGRVYNLFFPNVGSGFITVSSCFGCRDWRQIHQLLSPHAGRMPVPRISGLLCVPPVVCEIFNCRSTLVCRPCSSALCPPHAFFSRCSILPFRYSIYTCTLGIFGKNNNNNNNIYITNQKPAM